MQHRAKLRISLLQDDLVSGSSYEFMERLYKFMEKKSMQNYQTPVKNLCLWTSEARAADEKSISEVS